MPATPAALPFPSHGRWMDADGIPLLPLPWWATKGESPQAAATSAGPLPPLPSVRSRISGRGASRARAALKRLALASAWLPPRGWRAGPAAPGGCAALEGLLTSGGRRGAARCGADGSNATGGPRPAKAELLRRRRIQRRKRSAGARPERRRTGAVAAAATDHRRFCKSALRYFG
jgi:hypothetical protein